MQRKAQVYLYSSLAPATVRQAMLTPIRNITATIRELGQQFGPGARIAVLPEGPQTVPYLAPTPPHEADPVHRPVAVL